MWHDPDCWVALGLVGWLTLMFGFWLGTLMERAGWKIRALDENGLGSAHCPGGREGGFYYVVPEDVFNREFTRKRWLEPADEE